VGVHEPGILGDSRGFSASHDSDEVRAALRKARKAHSRAGARLREPRAELVSRTAPADMRHGMKVLLVGVVLLACASCRTTASTVASAPLPEVRVGTRERTWEVRCGGEPLGFVILFQERGLVRDSLYVVRNPFHQDLGVIDGLGRAFRYVPHCEEPVWVGSGTIAAGAREILGARRECELRELAEPAHERSEGSFGPVPDPSGAPSPEGGLAQSR
jgi:hypothetical protein